MSRPKYDHKYASKNGREGVKHPLLKCGRLPYSGRGWGGSYRRVRRHLDGLSVVVLQDLSIRLLERHTKHKEVLSRIPSSTQEEKGAKSTHVDGHRLGRTPSNSDPTVTHRTFPFPRPRLPIPAPPESMTEPRLAQRARRNRSLRRGDIQVQ